jgi:hypothetical protein
MRDIAGYLRIGPSQIFGIEMPITIYDAGFLATIPPKGQPVFFYILSIYERMIRRCGSRDYSFDLSEATRIGSLSAFVRKLDATWCLPLNLITFSYVE